MEGMLRAVAARWAQRPCLGTLSVVGEEDEPQPNGRVFTKVKKAVLQDQDLKNVFFYSFVENY